MPTENAIGGAANAKRPAGNRVLGGSQLPPIRRRDLDGRRYFRLGPEAFMAATPVIRVAIANTVGGDILRGQAKS